MSKRSYKPEEIVAQLHLLHSQCSTIADVIRQNCVRKILSYRWRKEYGGPTTDQVKRLKELEKENERLRRAVSELTLDKLIEKAPAKGKLLSPFRRRSCIDHIRKRVGVSERWARHVLGQHRSTQRCVPLGRADE